MAENVTERGESSQRQNRTHVVNMAVDTLKSGRDYQYISVLGRGTYGDVYRMYDPERDDDIAVKVVTPENVAEMEITLWPRLIHSNIVPLLELLTLRPMNVAVFIMPVQQKNLHDVLWDQRFRHRPGCLDQIKSWMYEILCALEYIGSKQMCHLDIKVDNVLISQNSTAMLCDFSFLNLTTRPLKRYDLGLPYIYRPPEACPSLGSESIIDGKAYDMWGYGIMCTEIMTHFIMATQIPDCNCWIEDVYPTLFEALQEKKFGRKFTQTYPADNVDRVEIKLALNFIQGFLAPESCKRCSPTTALEHQFLGYGDGILNLTDALWIDKKKGLTLYTEMMEDIRTTALTLTSGDSKLVASPARMSSNSENSEDGYLTINDESPSKGIVTQFKHISDDDHNIYSPEDYEDTIIEDSVTENTCLCKVGLYNPKDKYRLRAIEHQITADSSENSDNGRRWNGISNRADIIENEFLKQFTTSELLIREIERKVNPNVFNNEINIGSCVRAMSCTCMSSYGATDATVCKKVSKKKLKETKEYFCQKRDDEDAFLESGKSIISMQDQTPTAIDTTDLKNQVHDTSSNVRSHRKLSNLFLQEAEYSCKSRERPSTSAPISKESKIKTGMDTLEHANTFAKRCSSLEFDVIGETGATGDSLQAEYEETYIAEEKMGPQDASTSMAPKSATVNKQFKNENQIDVPQEAKSLRDKLNELDMMFDRLETMLACENCSQECYHYDTGVKAEPYTEPEVSTSQSDARHEENIPVCNSTMDDQFVDYEPTTVLSDVKESFFRRNLKHISQRRHRSETCVTTLNEEELRLKAKSPSAFLSRLKIGILNQEDNSESEENIHVTRGRKFLKWLRHKYLDIERVVQRKSYKILK